MRNTSVKFKPVSGTDNSFDLEAGAAPSKLATSLTLAAMSLGYGVVQLDVTIVNTALNAIGTSLGGGVAELQWVVSAYTIAFAAFILTASAMGDRIGPSAYSSPALPFLRRPPLPARWRPMQRR